MAAQTPCTLNPDAYLQPGEQSVWEHTASARWAVAQCRNNCPMLQQCAEDALSAGTCEGQKTPRVADGVIMGGVVCHGDSETYRALHAVARPDETPAPYVQGDGLCADCERAFIPKSQRVGDVEGVAHRATKSHSLCLGCYMKHWRAGTLTPARPAVPDVCVSCVRPMSRGSQQVVGFVLHESGGCCTTCVRKAARALKVVA